MLSDTFSAHFKFFKLLLGHCTESVHKGHVVVQGVGAARGKDEGERGGLLRLLPRHRPRLLPQQERSVQSPTVPAILKWTVSQEFYLE
jgi:hypothetical protein